MKTLTLLLALLCITTLAQTPITDPRDGKTYKTVKIGEQIWLAENLNYNAEGSKCYDNKPENCEKYGRLYNWDMAINVCPSGWHLPSEDEYEELHNMAGGREIAGKKLKTKSGWADNCDGCNGTDEFGFSALPGGYGYIDGPFYAVGFLGYWWSAKEYEFSDHYAYRRNLFNKFGDENWKEYEVKRCLFSVRCIKGKSQGGMK